MSFILPNGVEIPEEDLPIWSAYNCRCVIHSHLYAVCLHEEPTKSTNPNWREEPWNRYPVCRTGAKEYLDYWRSIHFPTAEQALRGMQWI